MKIKMHGRYDLDYEQETPKLNQRKHTGMENVETEVLRNLWLAKFGERAVTMRDMYDARGDDIADVAQELVYRNLVKYETLNRPDMIEIQAYWVLEK